MPREYKMTVSEVKDGGDFGLPTYVLEPEGAYVDGGPAPGTKVIVVAGQCVVDAHKSEDER